MIDTWNIDLMLWSAVAGVLVTVVAVLRTWPRSSASPFVAPWIPAAVSAILLGGVLATAMTGKPSVPPALGLGAAISIGLVAVAKRFPEGSADPTTGRIATAAFSLVPLAVGAAAVSPSPPGAALLLGVLSAAAVIVVAGFTGPAAEGPSEASPRPGPVGSKPWADSMRGSTITLGVAACLWTATPDTEAMAVAIGALLAPAIVESSTGRIGRPEPVAGALVLLAATVEFRGRPAGAAVVAVAALLLIAHHLGAGARPRRSIATAVLGLVALLIAARTGGLRAEAGPAIAWCLGPAFAIALLAAFATGPRGHRAAQANRSS